MSNPALNDVQRWLKSVIVNPGNLGQKLSLAQAENGLEANLLVKGDERVPLETRIGIYANGYLLRLLECMQADLPSLYNLLGPDLFELFARGYLIEHPPTSYSLFQLTAGFAAYLDGTHPPIDEHNAEKTVEYKLPGELVRMERARLAVLLNKGTEGVQTTPAIGFFDFFSGNNTQIKAHPALELLTQKMPLIQLYRHLMTDEEFEFPPLKTTYVAVTRVNFKIQFYELSTWQYLFLEYLKTAEKALHLYDIIHAISPKTEKDKSELLSEASLWLPNALQLGLITEG